MIVLCPFGADLEIEQGFHGFRFASPVATTLRPFGAITLFTLIALPAEFDASKRALLCLSNGGYLTPDELTGSKRVLDAAAWTYVAAFVTSLLTLLYWAYRLGLIGGRR